MTQEIIRINLLLPYRMGSVNCYLLKTDTICILIDTGCSKRRADLDRELEKAGCAPSNLKLIILTHGDFDHTGNAAYLRKKLDVKVAMHPDDSGMAERGNMFWNRKKSNFIVKALAPVLFGFGKSERFKPDLYLNGGDYLSEHGLDARVVHIPGHSKGSIGILTGDDDLFCGDLIVNADKPQLNSIIDDPTEANSSIERLRNMNVKTVYPGHGEPFPMELFIKNER